MRKPSSNVNGGNRQRSAGTTNPEQSLSTILSHLSNEESFSDVRLNKFTGVVECIDSVTIAKARLFLDTVFGKTPQRNLVVDALELLADQRSYDPLIDHVESLARWDGTQRVKTWLCEYAGAQDDDYTRAVGTKTLIGLIARALNPGCKLDTMLVLKGNQGARKGTLFETIGGEFYKSNLNVGDLHGKESRQEIRGSWIIEFPELNTIRKSDMDSTKAFLSERIDKYRPSYGRHQVTVPRRAIFCGTINSERPFLQESEKQRRFWIVSVGKAEIERLSGDREQLLAEARDMYMSGVSWWFSDQDEEDHRERMEEEQRLCRVEDPWFAKIETSLRENISLTETTISDILQNVLHLTSKDMSRSAEMRVAAIIGNLGWTKNRSMKSGERIVRWSRTSG